MFMHHLMDGLLAGAVFAPDSTSGTPSDSSESSESSSSETSESSQESSSQQESSESSTPPDIEVSVEDSQGLPTISDEELMGTLDESDDDSAATDGESDSGSQETTDDTDDSATEKKPAPSESKADDSTDSKDTDDTDNTDTKDSSPPKGFVPTQALHEVRGENKYLKERIADLQKQVSTPKKTEQSEPDKLEKPEADFNILSIPEFEQLTEDDPASALKYMQKLNNHKDALRDYDSAVAKQDQEAMVSERTQEELSTLFTETNRAMEEIVPGLFDKDGGAQKELAEFADSLGFTDDMYYLTNPETQIILPGESEPLYLGEHAATVIQVLAQAREKSGSKKSDEAEVTKLTETLTAKIRKEVEAELIAKFKTKKAVDFRSLNEVPDSKGGMEFEDKVLSDAAFAKLGPKEQEAYLAGA